MMNFLPSESRTPVFDRMDQPCGVTFISAAQPIAGGTEH